jgi:hypothetical protein
MKLSAPKQITWWVAVVLGVIGVIGYLIEIPVLSDYAGWVVFAAFVILAAATRMENL